ncbi:MAG: protein translocase subunit SecD [Deltaproteobacteria bacterium]|nr:protein translocase subunit SecD [Deltaproteobacteria bacterium]
MDRGWYLRVVFVLGLAVFVWFVLWPSLDRWVPAPAYLKKINARRISPGLDIRGGLRLMYEVEVDEAVRDRRDTRADQLLVAIGEKIGVIPEGEAPDRDTRAKLRERFQIEKQGSQRITVKFKADSDTGKIDREFVKRYGDLKELSRSNKEIVLEVRTDFLENIRETAVDQARETISNRIDALGLRETSVLAQDTDIIVEVPGADETAFDRIREIIGKTARLEFKIVDDESTFIEQLAEIPKGFEKQTEYPSAGKDKPKVASTYLVTRGKNARQKLTDYVDSLAEEGKIPLDRDIRIGMLDPVDDEKKHKPGEEAWRTYFLYSLVEVTGQDIEDTWVDNDPQTSKPIVLLNFNDAGANKFRKLTGENIKRRMAIILDDRVESAPTIQTEIGRRCQITMGGYRAYNEILNEAKNLVIVLKAGALPVPIRPANEQMIGPTLGHDAIQAGSIGALIGVTIVLVFMLLYYQIGGLIADLMVILNLLLILGTMAFFEATLTLPGIAALALTIGMAVDANVLINERIREELRAGKSARSAVDQGYARAFWSIFDSQITTFLAGVVLFQYGTGPIKGFAVMLIIGICTSLFTGVFCSRVLFDWVVRGLRVERIRVG